MLFYFIIIYLFVLSKSISDARLWFRTMWKLFKIFFPVYCYEHDVQFPVP